MSRFLDPRHATLEPYTPGEQPKVRRFIKLNTNENPYPPSPEVQRVINRDEVDRLRLYSDPTAGELVEAIAEYYGLRREQVFTTNGSDEALAFSFMAFCGQKGVQYPAVSYGFYAVSKGGERVWTDKEGNEYWIHPQKTFKIHPDDTLPGGKKVVFRYLSVTDVRRRDESMDGLAHVVFAMSK